MEMVRVIKSDGKYDYWKVDVVKKFFLYENKKISDLIKKWGRVVAIVLEDVEKK